MEQSTLLQHTLPTDTAHATLEPQEGLSHCNISHGLGRDETFHELNSRQHDIDSSDLFSTVTATNESTNSIGIKTYSEDLTSPTSILSIDRNDAFHKDTNTAEGAYDSDSIHSSASDATSDIVLQCRGSSTNTTEELLKEIGSHFAHDNTRYDSKLRPSTVSPVPSEDSGYIPHSSDRTYGEKWSVTNPAAESLPPYSSKILSSPE